MRPPHLLAALAGLLLSLVLVADATAKTIVGTPGPDRLVGRSAAGDRFYGGGGADRMTGGGGNNEFYGMRSGNRIVAGDGSNYVEGGPGNDDVTLGNGNNTYFGGTGHDKLVVGDGNNFMDDGGASGVIRAGNGNNVLHTGSGGGDYVLGNGNNVVYYGSGAAKIVVGTGVNVIFINSDSAPQLVDCGGNPQTVLYTQRPGDVGWISNRNAIAEGRIRNCPNVVPVAPQIPTGDGVYQSADGYDGYDFVGTDGDDTLLGGHGSGRIDGRGGNNVLWADHIPTLGGALTRRGVSTITAGDGNNEIYGGRGTNVITVGRGHNFIRGGDNDNRITTNGGDNKINLQGQGSNEVVLRGGRGYVESFANGRAPRITCAAGAKAAVVFGRVRPRTNCAPVASAYSRKGQVLQIRGLLPIQPSYAGYHDGRLTPGQNGVGRPRPAWTQQAR